MHITNFKISSRLFALAAIAIISLIVVAWYGFYSVSVFEKSYSVALNDLKLAQNATDLARSSQVSFKKQVQEWKNILIRGNDPKKFQPYLDLFKQEHTAVVNDLTRLKATMQQLRLPATKLDDAISIHTLLLDKYFAALEKFDKNDSNAGKIVDALVSGIDREPTKAIDDIVKDINTDCDKILQTTTEKVNATKNDIFLAFSAIISGVIISICVLSFIIIRSITIPLNKCVAFSKSVTAGKFDTILEVASTDEIGILADALRSMVADLKTQIDIAKQRSDEALAESEKAKQAMEQAVFEGKLAEQGRKTMHQAAHKIDGVVAIATAASEKLAAQIEQSSRGSEEQSRRVGETATAMEEMNATVLEVARNAAQAAATSTQAKLKAEEGARIVGQVVDFMTQVKEQARQSLTDMGALGSQAEGIGNILSVISDIADQTNLLALNAAIEAARAGDAGRGFAVVADEVRKLAEKTMTATKEVGEAIRGIQQGTKMNYSSVEQAVHAIEEMTVLAGKSGDALRDIVLLVDQTSDQAHSIATASEEQSSASEEINRSIEEVATLSAETAQAMGQADRAVSDLAAQTQVLQNLVAEMTTQSTTADAASPKAIASAGKPALTQRRAS
ncbi:HAMP domain-containing protein [Desulfovibrio aerotolerans]|uniref:HAMP domain-containing protein n=1 Tax=Solidesulfovibrio aerotolerans TaxID=295255 RepID=A0A7C9MIP6_9BACT|nr:methyl-accepting chemotaxis protein [Solidesulfovibrio aerotolerans]MYL81553.1 HAMP domain-containing protein [Solidesulfovibrio aerotolerans]